MRGGGVGNSIVRIYLLYLRVGMVSGGPPHLISVAKYNKYALRGVLGFDAKGGHITYENTYHSSGLDLSLSLTIGRFSMVGIY